MKRKSSILLMLAGFFLCFTGISNVSASAIAAGSAPKSWVWNFPGLVANTQLPLTGNLISHQAISIGALLLFICLVIILFFNGYLKNLKNYAKIRDYCYIMLALICLSSAILATFHIADLGFVILLAAGWAYYSRRIKKMN